MTQGLTRVESHRRRVALGVLGLMLIIFIFLSGFSFLGSRPQVTPDQVSYGRYSAIEGKRVFQAYNCMGCHTIVGNGAYLGPDLTREYAKAGPAWLETFLPSAGSWPTGVAVSVQLQDSTVAAEAGATSLEEYFQEFPGARRRVERRGGGATHMPNLPFSKDEIGALIAFLKYTSEMNTEGWPPVPRANPTVRRQHEIGGQGGTVSQADAQPDAAGSATTAPVASPDPIALGAKLVRQVGCTACHAQDGSKLIGPGFGGLFGSTVELTDGTTTLVDSAYLAESILHPDSAVVAGFPPGVMPRSYATLISESDRAAIIAYISSLGGK